MWLGYPWSPVLELVGGSPIPVRFLWPFYATAIDSMVRDRLNQPSCGSSKLRLGRSV